MYAEFFCTVGCKSKPEKEQSKRLLNPRLTETEQKLFLEKAAAHDRKVKKEHEKYERRIKLCKVFTKRDFMEYFNMSRQKDQRMILLLCAKEFDDFLFRQ